MDFISVLRFLIEHFQQEKIDFALIGGLALQAFCISRTTTDMDLIGLKEHVGKIR